MKSAPSFKNWNSYFLRCIEKHVGETDESLIFNFTFFLSPGYKSMGKEYKIIAKAIKSENGSLINEHFYGNGFEFIDIEYDGDYDSVDDLKMEVQNYYQGEKFGFVTEFSLTARLEKCLDSEFGDLLNLNRSPESFVKALNFFNAISYGNTTHLIRFHQIWNQLHEIQSSSYDFIGLYQERVNSRVKVQSLSTGKTEDLIEYYDGHFYPKGSFKIKKLNDGEKKTLVKMINGFKNEFQIKRKDIFGTRREYREQAHSYSQWYKNSFEGYFGKVLNTHVYYLEKAKILTECGYCGDVFIFKKGKKFCSQIDGKSCGKSMRNRRTYLRTLKKTA